MKHLNPLLSAFFAASIAMASGAFAQTAPAHVVERGTDVPAVAQAAMARIVGSGAPGVTLVVARGGTEISRVHTGAIDSTAQLRIASASKWLVAATIMRLVDEGKLSLDAPISRYLPQISGEAGTITLRQSLAQTTGTAGTLDELYDLNQDARITLTQSATEILARPQRDRPGASFMYGGPGFQIAGAAAEAVTGQRWEEIFQSRIARPLGMRRTYWMHLRFNPAEQIPAAETLNPVLQGGAVSTVDDYMAFLTMLAQDGQFNGRRILSAGSVAEMHRNQTLHANLPRPEGLPVLAESRYSLGNWCERWDRQSRCTRSSSIGAFGTYPWIDRATGLYGIIFLHGDMQKVWTDLLTAQGSVIQANRR